MSKSQDPSMVPFMGGGGEGCCAGRSRSQRSCSVSKGSRKLAQCCSVLTRSGLLVSPTSSAGFAEERVQAVKREARTTGRRRMVVSSLSFGLCKRREEQSKPAENDRTEDIARRNSRR